MCRNITTLRGLEPPATADEIEAAAVQYVRKVTGITKVTEATREAFNAAVAAVAAATAQALADLPERRNPPSTVPHASQPARPRARSTNACTSRAWCTATDRLCGGGADDRSAQWRPRPRERSTRLTMRCCAG
jgi:hypothetical protein